MFNFLSKIKSTKENQYYFGLILKEGEGVGLILQLDQTSQTIIKVDERRFEFTNSWEHIIEDVDQVLYELEQKHNLSLPQAIIFLYSHLVDQKTKEIKKPYIKRIKSIVDELGLKALGFIEFHEAISLFLTQKEAVPLTSIIVELDQPLVTLFIYKGGEMVFTDAVAKTENLVADLESLFNKIKGEIILPSRLILYDSSKLTKESEQIVTHKWDEALFIQIPRVEILVDGDLERALLHSFSRQFSEAKGGVKAERKNTDNAMGFMIGQDIKELKGEEPIGVELKKTRTPHAQFARHESTEVTSEPSSKVSSANIASEPETKEPIGDINYEAKQLNSFGSYQSKIGAFFSSIVQWPRRFFSQFNFKANSVLLLFLGAFLIISAIISLLFFLHKASIKLYFDGKKEEKELTIKGSIGGSGSGGILSVAKFEKTIASSDSKDTTGNKTVGEKASGSVTIYNKDIKDITFKKGSVLTDSKSTKFVLDSEVKVASASESLTSEGNVLTVTGKAKAVVKAADIGPSGNIKKDEKLTIEGFSQTLYFAIVESAFTGGTKKEVKTVSKEDLADLKEKLTERVKKEKDKLLAEKKDEVKIIDTLTDVNILDEKYSKEIGEEGDSLNLNAKAKVTAFTYKGNDLKSLIYNEFKNVLPKNYELPLDYITYSIKKATKTDERIEIVLKISGKLIPKIDVEQFKKRISGKNVSRIEAIVKEEFKANGYKLEVDTPVNILKPVVPFFKRNLSVSVESL